MERAEKFLGSASAQRRRGRPCSACGAQEGGAGLGARLVVQKLQALLHARLERAAHGERHAGHQRRRHRRHGRKARERGLGCHGGGDGRGGAEAAAAAAAAAARRRAPPPPPGSAQPRGQHRRLCRTATVRALHVRSSLSPLPYHALPAALHGGSSALRAYGHAEHAPAATRRSARARLGGVRERLLLLLLLRRLLLLELRWRRRPRSRERLRSRPPPRFLRGDLRARASP